MPAMGMPSPLVNGFSWLALVVTMTDLLEGTYVNHAHPDPNTLPAAAFHASRVAFTGCSASFKSAGMGMDELVGASWVK